MRNDRAKLDNGRVPSCQLPEQVQPIRKLRITFVAKKPEEWPPSLAHKLNAHRKDESEKTDEL